MWHLLTYYKDRVLGDRGQCCAPVPSGQTSEVSDYHRDPPWWKDPCCLPPVLLYLISSVSPATAPLARRAAPCLLSPGIVQGERCLDFISCSLAPDPEALGICWLIFPVVARGIIPQQCTWYFPTNKIANLPNGVCSQACLQQRRWWQGNRKTYPAFLSFLLAGFEPSQALLPAPTKFPITAQAAEEVTGRGSAWSTP